MCLIDTGDRDGPMATAGVSATVELFVGATVALVLSFGASGGGDEMRFGMADEDGR